MCKNGTGTAACNSCRAFLLRPYAASTGKRGFSYEGEEKCLLRVCNRKGGVRSASLAREGTMIHPRISAVGTHHAVVLSYTAWQKTSAFHTSTVMTAWPEYTIRCSPPFRIPAQNHHNQSTMVSTTHTYVRHKVLNLSSGQKLPLQDCPHIRMMESYSSPSLLRYPTTSMLQKERGSHNPQSVSFTLPRHKREISSSSPSHAMYEPGGKQLISSQVTEPPAATRGPPHA